MSGPAPQADAASALLSNAELAALLAVLPEARVVGGAVRDSLLGRPVADIDLATPERPESVMRRLERAGLRALPTGLDHGTVTALVGGRPFEVTTLRRDVETDGRHARVAFTDDWRADAARRDFTINALSLDRTGRVFDYFGGIADLWAGRVRFVGDPATRIAEDYLRSLRFFRFQARYGRGAPDRAALDAIRANLSGLSRLSAERVWSELRRILTAPDPSAAVRLMQELGVTAALGLPPLDPRRLARLVPAGLPRDPVLRLAVLLPPGADGTEAVAERLRLSNQERNWLDAIRAGPPPRPEDDEPALARLLADQDPETLIARTWIAGGAGPAWDALRARLGAAARPVFPLSGRDVVALGVPPGPEVGAILKELREGWLAEGCRPDAAALKDRLKARLKR